LGVVALVGVWPVSVAARQVLPDSVGTVFVTDTIPGYGAVGGIAVDALGFVYVADFRNAVWRLSPDGDLVRFADGLYGASGNAIGPDGDLFQSSFYGHYVARISRTGVVERWVDEGLSGPVGIAAASDGSLFVVNCNAGTVSKVSPDRQVEEFARHDAMACPNGITFDDRGDLYVVSFGDTHVLRITPDGGTSVFTDIPGAGGNAHITFTRGAFFVTKLRGNRVYRVQRDGTVTVLAGTGAQGGTDGPALDATFAGPNGIAASPGGGSLWVNDLVSGQGLGRGTSVVALRHIRMVTLGEVLGALPEDVGPDALADAHAAYHRARPGEDSSAGAIALGFQWLSAGRIAGALAVFRLNAAMFADDPASVFQYGEALRYTGQPALAAEQYRRVLELDPDHPVAGARLGEVGG
jgi:sugar lactone lactonase YvrE